MSSWPVRMMVRLVSSIRLRKVLATGVDVLLLDLACLGVAWIERSTGHASPVSFGTVFWGAYLACLAIARRTPGMFVVGTKLWATEEAPLGNPNGWSFRCLLRVATTYAMVRVAPGVLGELPKLLPRVPLHVSLGVYVSVLLASFVGAYLFTPSVQDVLSRTYIGKAHSPQQKRASTLSAVWVWCGLCLCASAWGGIATAYAAGMLPNVRKTAAIFSGLEASSFFQSELRGINSGPVFLREEPGSPIVRPLRSSGPSVVVKVPVSAALLSDAGQRKRAVHSVLRCLSYLEWAGLTRSQTAEVVLYHHWVYGLASIQAQYSYVGIWTPQTYADGGAMDNAAEIPRSEPTFALSDIMVGKPVPRKRFEDVEVDVAWAVSFVFTFIDIGDDAYSMTTFYDRH